MMIKKITVTYAMTNGDSIKHTISAREVRNKPFKNGDKDEMAKMVNIATDTFIGTVEETLVEKQQTIPGTDNK